jgi:membrane-associated protease RseP (regulator of RpoE activity)
MSRIEDDTASLPPVAGPGGAGREVTSPAPVTVPGRTDRQALLQLLAVSGLVVLVAVASGHLNLLVVIVAIIVMVMVHELGHFLTAKWGGMKVTEYFLGFGPRLWSIRRGETEYGVKGIPLGGYVRIIGMSNLEEVDPADEPRTYRQQPFHNRLAVAVAGSFMHFVMAFLLLWTVAVFAGIPQVDKVSIDSLSALQGGADPARSAGLRPGDVFVTVDGTRIRGLDQLTATIGKSPGKPVTIEVLRDHRDVTVTVTPEPAPSQSDPKVTTGRIGIMVANPRATMSPLAAVPGAAGTGPLGLTHATWAVLQGVGHTFSPSGVDRLYHDVTNAQDASRAARTGDRPASIVGAVNIGTQAAQQGWASLLLFLVTLNIVFGLLNMFPMLPLDGGHVVIAVYERIRSRRGRMYHADVAKMTPVVYLFILLLVTLVVSTLFLDSTHPVQLPK